MKKIVYGQFLQITETNKAQVVLSLGKVKEDEEGYYMKVKYFPIEPIKKLVNTDREGDRFKVEITRLAGKMSYKFFAVDESEDIDHLFVQYDNFKDLPNFPFGQPQQISAEEILKDCEQQFIEVGRNSQDTVISYQDAINAINRYLKRDVNINTYSIDTALGKVHNADSLPFLTEEQLEGFNNVGYTGKDINGDRTNYQAYLNSLNIGKFTVRQTKWDDGDFSESFLITKVS